MDWDMATNHHNRHQIQEHDIHEDPDTDDTNGDGEGVWSPDIERCFREALRLFPPCGRRKHILQEEGGGKMYGRNELIARHIMMRTGKKRTRKQVSSHIQVLARRRAKAEAAAIASTGATPSPSSGGLRSQSVGSRLDEQSSIQQHPLAPTQTTPGYYDIWVDRPIVTQKIRLVEFAAFIENNFARHCYIQIDYTHNNTIGQSNKLERIDISQIQDKFPEIGGPEGLFQRGPPDSFFLVKFWADLNNEYEYNIEDQNSYFGFSSHFETVDPYKNITCSTKACSYGLQVVEKVEKVFGTFNSSNGRYSYNINRSPMCEFMIQFIKKLRQLPRASQMNSVLENFTVLQVITSESTSEILLCLAYVFEVSLEHSSGPQYHVYRLTKD